MRGRMITVTMLTLLVASAFDIVLLPAAARVQPSVTQGPIYINDDGSVDPPTAPITRNGDVYTLTDNIISVGTTGTSYCGITIHKSGVTLDGAGFTIQGTGFSSTPYAIAGVELYNVSDVTVMNGAIKNFMLCIDLVGSSRDIIERNTLTEAASDPIGGASGSGVSIAGIYMPPYPAIVHGCYDNSILENTIVDCPVGISVTSSSGNTISGNTVTASVSDGIGLSNASNNVLDGNVLTDNKYGIWIGTITPGVDLITEMTDSSKNTLYGNRFGANQFAVIISPRTGANCSGNAFYHNNFVYNTHEVLSGYPSVESWDDGYPSGGNYWSNYTGEDVKSGPSQDQPGSDGIGDTPYVIDSDNIDHYPLMRSWGSAAQPYEVTILAYCVTEGADVTVGVMMDWSPPSNLSTPHTFTGLNGSHTFTVSDADAEGHPFSHWSNGQTSTTLRVSNEGNYTARYRAPAPSGNVIRVPEDYKSVQAAIDATSSGSTIVIGPGVYNESIIVNKNLTIIGKLGCEPIFKGGGSGIAITLLAGASGSLIAGIVITSWDEGMLINNASDCKIYDNIMSQMNNCGIALQGNDTSNNFICSNIFQNTTVAIVLTSSSHNNTVYRNIISSNDLGVELESGKNLICANSITENDIGLDLSNSNNSVIYHNNFVNNSAQVSISTSIGNTWDDGYPSGGNYWSDHTGPDLYNGPNQDQLGADGIVDTDYVVAGGGVDRYPLTQPFNAHDVGITECTILNTVVGGGYTLHVEVKVLNYGSYDENFLVTVYANSHTAVTQGVALARSSSIIITLTWNTTGFAYGNYTISARAGPVPGETNTADNNFTKGWIMVSLVGDITGPIGCPDGRCDMRDVGAVARLFGINYPSPQYNPNYDINSDSKINMIDIGTVARHFGEHYP